MLFSSTGGKVEKIPLGVDNHITKKEIYFWKCMEGVFLSLNIGGSFTSIFSSGGSSRDSRAGELLYHGYRLMCLVYGLVQGAAVEVGAYVHPVLWNPILPLIPGLGHDNQKAYPGPPLFLLQGTLDHSCSCSLARWSSNGCL